MGIQEQEIIEKYREMLAERKGVNITTDGLAILTAARILKRVAEKCCIEICGAIEQSQLDQLKLTLPQANAIIDMDDHGYACDEWIELLKLAETVTGRTDDANFSDAQVTAREAAAKAREAAYHKSQEEARQEIADLMLPLPDE